MSDADVPPPLPELQDAILDESTLTALLDDIRREATVLAVMVKGAPEALCEGAGALDEAIAWLREGRVRAMQIRYRHQGRAWTDTLMRTPAGVRLVRAESH